MDIFNEFSLNLQKLESLTGSSKSFAFLLDEISEYFQAKYKFTQIYTDSQFFNDNPPYYRFNFYSEFKGLELTVTIFQGFIFENSIEVKLYVADYRQEYFQKLVVDCPDILKAILERNRASIRFQSDDTIEKDYPKTKQTVQELKIYLSANKLNQIDYGFSLVSQIKPDTPAVTIKNIFMSQFAVFDAALCYLNGSDIFKINKNFESIFGSRTPQKKIIKTKFFVEIKWDNNCSCFYLRTARNADSAARLIAREQQLDYLKHGIIGQVISEKESPMEFQKILETRPDLQK